MMPGGGSVSEYPVAAGPAGGSSIPPVDPTRQLKGSGQQAALDASWLVGASFLLAASLPNAQFQPNAAEHQGRTHELATLQSQQVSGLLRAQQPGAAPAADNAPRQLENVLIAVEAQDSFAWSQYLDYFDQPNLRPEVGAPERPAELLSSLLRAQAPSAAAVVEVPRRPEVTDAPLAEVFRSGLFLPRFEPVLQQVRFDTVDPQPPGVPNPQVFRPRFEQPLQTVRLAEVDPQTPAAPESAIFRARQPEPVVATNRSSVLVAQPGPVEAFDSFGWSQYLDYFDAPLLRPIVGLPERPADLASLLLRSQEPTVVQAVNVPNVPHQADAAAVEVYRSGLFSPRFEAAAVQQNLRPLVVDPGRPQEFDPTRTEPRFEAEPQGIQPKLLYGLFEAWTAYSAPDSRLTPPHFEPFVPPPPPPPETPQGGATIGDPYVRALLEQQAREFEQREQAEADARLRKRLEAERADAKSGPEVALPPAERGTDLARAPRQRDKDGARAPLESDQTAARVAAVEQALDAKQAEEAARAEAERQAQLEAIRMQAIAVGVQIDLAALQEEDDLEAILALLMAM